MNSTRRAFFVETRDIHYIRSTMESYDGMALVRTVDPGPEALLEVMIAPGCEEQVMALVQGLEHEEGIPMSPAANPCATPKHAASRNPSGVKRYAVLTMGCQMNEYDSEYAQRCLDRAGFRPAPAPQDADFVLINTCSVREKAEQKAMSTLGRMISIKRRKPGMIIAFAGCVAQQQGSALLERFPALDLVVGTRRIHRIAYLVERLMSTGERLVDTALETEEILPAPPAACEDGTGVKGFITIMQGCNNYCSYCIVPYVRGREVSRPPEAILQEAEDLIGRGAREITLLGQNVNSYLWRMGGERVDFPGLLRRIDSISGLKRLRFTTSHPKDLTGDLIRSFSELKNLCGHIHLPFQAGSNEVLRRMNRKYTREEYLELVARLREVCPGIGITADVMVGFPGETAGDFHDTMSLIENVRFDNLYSFKYSDRQGTAASGFADKIDEAVKTDRLSLLQGLQKQITLENNRALEGTEMEVLVEGPSKKGDQSTGRSDCNRVVNFDLKTKNIGDLVKVKIKEGRANSLLGEAIVMSINRAASTACRREDS
ncbi:MAG: tRNA (N6-isopentenyl adenosine(37)-C2)-methylthiotransferase MiaB [Thermodesulfobacteriota bacterium]